jgi:aryl-alcohol dehydrogenase-like predicted oxidoreductase
VVRIGSSDLEIFPLSLGGNVFGWTSDEAASFAVLDAFVAGGGNFIDTADVYSAWLPGHTGGESETVIGNWMAARGNRDRVIVATKVASHAEAPGASRASIEKGVEASLRRLRTDYIDLYYIHRDDAETPLEETIAALDDLVKAGKVRAIAASNFSAERLEAALAVSDSAGSAKFVALQPHYNLVHRHEYEGALEAVVAGHGLATIPYASLAKGFLTGKYRDGNEASDTSPRASGARAYLDDRGRNVLAALDEIAAAHDVPVTAVSLAWLRQQPTVVAPIASASTVEQVPALLAGATLELSADEVERLTAVSEQRVAV